MKNRQNSTKGCTERLREQENKANGAFKVPKRCPEAPNGGGKNSPKGSRLPFVIDGGTDIVILEACLPPPLKYSRY